MANKEYKDIVIIGGGMTGAACASGLAPLGLQIQLIEKSPPPSYDFNQPYDLRISAISEGSVSLLKKLKAWDFIQQGHITPYSELQVGEMQGFDAHFSSQLLNLPQLGFMLENNLIQWGLWQTFPSYSNIHTSTNCSIKKMAFQNHHWTIELHNGQIFETPWVIAADGAKSKVREMAGIGVSGWQYRQDCFLILVQTKNHFPPVTWQKFYTSGPRALLPLKDGQACLIWYDSPTKIKQLKSLSPPQLIKEIEQHFPYQFLDLSIQQFGSFPLTRQHALDYVKNHVILVGDSAHTINPLAGQGVNLGFKDVNQLIETFRSAAQTQKTITSDYLIQHYQQKRKYDNLLMQTAMDLCYKGFKEEILPLKILRNSALLFAEKCTPLKKQIIKQALAID